MKIYPIKRKPRQNRYCGPGVVSLLTGLDPGTAADLIRSHSGQRNVKGTWTIFVLRSLHDCGLQTKLLETQPQRFSEWLEETRLIREAYPTRVFFVVTKRHFQIIQGDRFCDNATHDLVDLSDPRVRPGQTVMQVHEVMGEAMQSSPAVEQLKAGKRAKRSEYGKQYVARRKVKEIEALGIIEVDEGNYETRLEAVWPAKALCDLPGFDDPFEGDHWVDTWEEALDRAKEYKALYDQLRGV